MTNTTQTFWDVDGVSLQTYARNIVTLGGDRMAPPPMRGSDIVVPYRPGAIWVEKVTDSRTITLGMWISGANPDGSIPIDRDLRQAFVANWNALRKLLWTPRRQFTLTKRFWVLESELEAAGVALDELPRSGSGAFTYRLYSASARGQFAGGLAPNMDGTGHAAFTVDIRLADPFFRSEALSFDFSVAVGGQNAGPTETIYVLGDDRTTDIEVVLEGPTSAARLTNVTHNVWLRYNYTVADGIRARIEVDEFRARHDIEGTAFKSAGYIQHDGDPFWLYLEPGDNEVTLTASGGSGEAKLSYTPRWF